MESNNEISAIKVEAEHKINEMKQVAQREQRKAQQEIERIQSQALREMERLKLEQMDKDRAADEKLTELQKEVRKAKEIHLITSARSDWKGFLEGILSEQRNYE